MYSDNTRETQIFILGTGICKCHMLFTITGINVSMTAKMGYGILSHVNILLHLLVGFSHLCHLVFLVLLKILLEKYDPHLGVFVRDLLMLSFVKVARRAQ